MRRLLTTLIPALVLYAGAQPQLEAQTTAFSYQGRLVAGGTNFNGVGSFKFALLTRSANLSRQATATITLTNGSVASLTITDPGAGYTTAPAVTINTFPGPPPGSGALITAQMSGGTVSGLTVVNAGHNYSACCAYVTIAPPPDSYAVTPVWSDSGSTLDGIQPVLPVMVPVTDGLFMASLGDPATMAPLDPALFQTNALWLRLWFSADGTNYQSLSPDQPLLSAPYANFANTASNLLGTIATTQLTGALPISQLSGIVPLAQLPATVVANNETGVTLSGSFSGNGTNLTGVNAALLGGKNAGNFWQTLGNAGTSPTSGNFLGTTDNQPLEVRVNNQRVMRFEMNTNGVPNVIGGASVNNVAPWAFGNTIGGGGATTVTVNFTNYIAANFSVVGGGALNSILSNATFSVISGGGNDLIQTNAHHAVVAGGGGNVINSDSSTISGGQNNFIAAFSSSATIAGGQKNICANCGATVGGGGYDGGTYAGNRAGGAASTVAGGIGNNALADYSFVGGGDYNTLKNQAAAASIVGGVYNSINNDGVGSFIGGGYNNQIQAVEFNSIFVSGCHATIAGGYNNLIDTNGYLSFIGGGMMNSAEANAAVIGGGTFNTAFGIGSAIAGGYANQANGACAFAVGSGNYANGDQSVSEGVNNTASGPASVAFGTNCLTSGYASVALGENNSAIGDDTVALGQKCQATGSTSVAMGYGTTASGAAATAMGNSTAASGAESTAMGFYTAASAWASTALGQYSTANGFVSTAMGNSAQANHDGTFVWADNTGGNFYSTFTNEFSIRAQNGVRIQSNKGIHLDANNYPLIVRDYDLFANNAPSYKQGIGRWGLFMEPYNLVIGIPANDAGVRNFQVAKYSTNGTPTMLMQVDQSGNITNAGSIYSAGSIYAHGVLLTSDRNAKENFAPLNPQTVLAKVAALPVTEWNYKSDDSAQKHIGPMAQDFQTAFQLSADDKHISVVDEGGVALAAIQGLNEKVESGKQKAEILEARSQQLEAENADLKARLEKLEQLMAEKFGGAQ